VAIGSLLVCGTASLRAAGDPAEEPLKKQGLKLVGSLYLLDVDADIQKKMTEVRRHGSQLKLAILKQSATPSAKERQEAIKNLTASIDEYRAEIGATTHQINQTPRLGNRRGRGGGFGNNVTTEAYHELLAYRNQLQAELSNRTGLLNQLRNQKLDPDARARADADVRDRTDAYHQVLADLHKEVDSAVEKYGVLAKSAEVKRALDALSTRSHTTLKIGPSPRFLAQIKLLEKLEKASAEAAPDPEFAPEKTTRPGKKSARSRRLSKPATTN
jgi:hypothetical protein